MMEIIRELPSVKTMHGRKSINTGLATPGLPLVAIQGPCAPEHKSAHITLNEAKRFGLCGRTLTGIVAVESMPMSKPRSDPKKSWKGEHSTNPELALAMIEFSSRHVAVAMEIVEEEQIDIYISHLALAWTGARNEKNLSLKQRLASEHQDLPLPIKNSLSGEIDLTLKQIEALKAERDVGAGAIVLCYRGGENAQTPEEWENQYLSALELTGGLMIVYVAHGSEMAHDPGKNFQKSVLGQLACLDHVIELAAEGYVPAGIKIEASNAASPVDPVIPFEDGFRAIQRLRLTAAG